MGMNGCGLPCSTGNGRKREERREILTYGDGSLSTSVTLLIQAWYEFCSSCGAQPSKLLSADASSVHVNAKLNRAEAADGAQYVLVWTIVEVAYHMCLKSHEALTSLTGVVFQG